MEIVEAIVGNINDPKWQTLFKGYAVERIELDQWEAQKNRFRKHSSVGTEVAVSLERGSHLQDGDILIWNESDHRAVVVAIQFKEVMVVELSEIMKQQTDKLVQTCVELGHAIGNQHWPAVIKGTRVYVPLTVDRNVMASVMKTHGFPGVSYYFVTGAEVIPYLAPHEARRLFGGTDIPSHAHVHGDGHSEHVHNHV
jgi:urease accessory protein